MFELIVILAAVAAMCAVAAVLGVAADAVARPHRQTARPTPERRPQRPMYDQDADR